MGPFKRLKGRRMGNVLEMPRGEPRPPACREARRVTAMTAAYEALDSLIIELHQLRADNRRLKFELGLDQLRADNSRLNLELAAARSQRDSCSSASPLVGVTGRPELLCW